MPHLGVTKQRFSVPYGAITANDDHDPLLRSPLAANIGTLPELEVLCSIETIGCVVALGIVAASVPDIVYYTLNYVLDDVGPFQQLYNVIYAFAHTANLSDCKVSARLVHKLDGGILTVRHHYNITKLPLIRFDAVTLRVTFLLFNVILAATNTQHLLSNTLLAHLTGSAPTPIFVEPAPNAPPPRPPPKTY